MIGILRRLTGEETNALVAEILRGLSGADGTEKPSGDWRSAPENGYAEAPASALNRTARAPYAQYGDGEARADEKPKTAEKEARLLDLLYAAVSSAAREQSAAASPDTGGGEEAGDKAIKRPYVKPGGETASSLFREIQGEGRERGALMTEVSDFFRRDSRRYDNGFELY